MSIRRTIVLVPSLSLLACLYAAEPVVAPVATPAPVTAPVPASETSAPIDAALMARIDVIISSAIANGFPDGTGALLFKGPLVVVQDKAKADEADQTANQARNLARQMRRRQHGGNQQEDDNGEHVTTTYDGVHVKLKDGSYFVGLGFLQRAEDGVVIQVDKLTPLALTEVRGANKPEHMPSDEEMGQVSKNFSSNQVTGMRAAMRWAGVLEGLGFQGSAEMAAILIRAGVQDAHELIWAEMFRDMSTQMMSSEPPFYLNQADAQVGMQALNKRMMRRFSKAKGGQPEVPKIPDATLDTYLRKGLVRWFKAQIVSPDPGMTEARAIAGLRAILGDAVSPAQREELRLFDEYAQLPVTIPADAPVAERLARWEPETLPMGITAQAIEQMDADDRLKMGYKPASGTVITEADRGALFAALDDVRASGWLDKGFSWGMDNGLTPRTRGENALRALASQYGFDPRLLVGRDQFAAWDAAERSAAAKDLQTWYKAHSAESTAEQMKSVVTHLPAGRAAIVITNQPEADRPALVSAVLATWKKEPPTGPAAEGLGAMLVLAKSDPATKAIVEAWPITGSNRLLLAAWHDMHGDGKPIDSLIPEILTAPTEDMMQAMGSDQPDAQSLLAVLAARPTPERLAALKIHLAEHTTPAANHILQATLSGQWQSWSNPDLTALITEKDGPAQKALGFSLMATLLADRTAIPASAIKNEEWGMTIGEVRVSSRTARRSKKTAAGKAKDTPEEKKETVPTDLRWCDVAAQSVVDNPWQFRGGNNNGNEELEFKITDPVADRDQQIAAIRIAIDPAILEACKAAKIPAPAGGAPAPVNEKSLF